jgi:muramoyltetrapeptide carboxypeptidase
MKQSQTFLFLFCTLVSIECYSQTKMIQPTYLIAGDSVAIVAPSGILKNKETHIKLAKELLESWGLKVKIGDHVFSKANHFAGTDDERATDLQSALDNPNISAIWSARGGYGTVRVLDKLDFSKFKTHPKWLIGYSDITALHNQIHNEGVESMHAMMCTSMSEDMETYKTTVETFKKALFGECLAYYIAPNEYNKTGNTTGQLVGGNLTLLHTMLGSTTSIDTNGKIIFFEEIGEYKYHIDRMLQSLKRAGYFENCKGLIVGDMSNIRKNTTEWGTSIEQLILDALKDYDFPILFGFPAGHEDDNRALILGRTVQLTVGSEQSSVVFDN